MKNDIKSDIPKTTKNKLVSIGNALDDYRRKKALEDGIPIITYDKDGNSKIEFPTKNKK